MSALFELNDNCVTLTGLSNKVDGTFINDATATVTLQKDGADVGGETWPLSMPYVAASDGIYRATIQDTVDISAGEIVNVIVDAVSPAGTYNADVRVPVNKRGFSG